MNKQDEGISEKPKDTRFDLSVDPELTKKLLEAIEGTRRLANERPAAAIKICLDMQGIFRKVEQDAAVLSNSRFKMSWGKLEKVLGKNPHWAWDRYMKYGLSHPKSRRRSSKKMESEVEEQPEDS